MDKLTAKFKRERDDLREEMYRTSHHDLWMAVQDLDKMLRGGTTINTLMEKIREALVCDDATLHLYREEERKLCNAHARSRRKARRESAGG